jgi:hypothetical protein
MWQVSNPKSIAFFCSLPWNGRHLFHLLVQLLSVDRVTILLPPGYSPDLRHLSGLCSKEIIPEKADIEDCVLDFSPTVINF